MSLIPGTAEGSISRVVRKHAIEHRAASSDLPVRIDALMLAVGQGPCLDAVWKQRTVRVDDLLTDERWPKFSRAAATLGARSMLSFQLFVESHNLGALNLYGARPHAFTDESEHVGLLFATHAAIAFADVQNADNLESSIQSRGDIGTAIGILMERYGLGPDRAFTVLTRFSQQSNRKLRDIAEEIVNGTGQRS
ncbi:GAF and ANTAR domain-containing protein [Kribbella sp. NPDC051770]|uniref:GAF and ANTAR domain-containing protein n=1 Tax=Kribbella sp. NPDC051770 TaxID=3155413 RepID=UPI003441B215